MKTTHWCSAHWGELPAVIWAPSLLLGACNIGGMLHNTTRIAWESQDYSDIETSKASAFTKVSISVNVVKGSMKGSKHQDKNMQW